MVRTYKQAEDAGDVKRIQEHKGRATDFRYMKPREKPLGGVMRPGKTAKDKKSGAWAQHIRNKEARAEYNRGHKERVKKAVYDRRK